MKWYRYMWVAAVGLLALGSVLSQSASAATVKWTGGDGLWLDATKWEFAVGGLPTGHVPLGTEDVIIDAGPKIDFSPPVPPIPDVPVAKSLLLQGAGVTSFSTSLLTVSGDVMVDTGTVGVGDGAMFGAGGDIFVDNAGTLLVGDPLAATGGLIKRHSLELVGGTGNLVEINGNGKIELTGDTTIGVQGRIIVNANNFADKAALNAELATSTGNLIVAQSPGTTELIVRRRGQALFKGVATINGDVLVERGGLFRTGAAGVESGGTVNIDGQFFGPPIEPSTWAVGIGGLGVVGKVTVTNGGFLDVLGDVELNAGLAAGASSLLEIDGGNGGVSGNLAINRDSSLGLKSGNLVVSGDVTVGTAANKGGAFRIGNTVGSAATLDVAGNVTIDARSLGLINRIEPGGVLKATTVDFNTGLLVGRGLIEADVFNGSEIYIGSSADATKDVLNIVGNYTQELDGDLHIVLSGADFSTSDQLKINVGSSAGTASLAGDLILHVDSSLSVQAGDFVDLLLSKGTLAGTFNQILFQETGGFPGGLSTTSLGKPFEIQYIRNDSSSLQRVRLKIVPEPSSVLALTILLGAILPSRTGRNGRGVNNRL